MRVLYLSVEAAHIAAFANRLIYGLCTVDVATLGLGRRKREGREKERERGGEEGKIELDSSNNLAGNLSNKRRSILDSGPPIDYRRFDDQPRRRWVRSGPRGR